MYKRQLLRSAEQNRLSLVNIITTTKLETIIASVVTLYYLNPLLSMTLEAAGLVFMTLPIVAALGSLKMILWAI